MNAKDIFKNSRAKKTISNKKRSSKTKESLKRILIVSEGIKTEPIYFQYLVGKYKLYIADIKVTDAKSSCPLNVAKYAEKLYSRASNNGEPYDIVYCVFDKDTHAHYNNALSYISSRTPKGIYFIIDSIPCFEFWLLLHYKHTTKPFAVTRSMSMCEALISEELKMYLPDYVKNLSDLKQPDIDYILEDKTITKAIERSEAILLHCEEVNTDNPSTKIHKVVKELQNLKKKQEDLLK